MRATRNDGLPACEAHGQYSLLPAGRRASIGVVAGSGRRGEKRQLLASVGDLRLESQSGGIGFTAWAGCRNKASLQFVRFVSGKAKRTALIEGAFLFFMS